MTSIWVESLGRNFEQALDLMQAAVQDCTDELWEASMWPVPRVEGWWGSLRGPDGTVDSDPAVQDELMQRGSAPWFRAWHALEVLDYDLAGEMEPWKPPPPFDESYTGDVHRVWTRTEILGYVEWCRDRARTTLQHMTDENAATPLPPAHRYGGQPYAWHVTSIPGHTIEHATQIRQFVSDRAQVIDWLDELQLEPGPPWWSMGTRAIGAGHGFLPDADEEHDLLLKAELLANRHDEVFAALDTPAVAVGSRATLELVEAVTGKRAADSTLHPLDAAGRLVQEDLCLLTLRDSGVFLDAASLCFPSYWRLANKLGRPIDAVHAPVPGYDSELGGRVGAFIQRLKPGRPVWRRNWSIHDDPTYFLPESNAYSIDEGDLYLRSERQTLRRLPDTDAVLFTIRTQQAPLNCIEQQPDLAARMAAVIASWPADIVTYKGGHGAMRALEPLRSLIPRT